MKDLVKVNRVKVEQRVSLAREDYGDPVRHFSGSNAGRKGKL